MTRHRRVKLGPSGLVLQLENLLWGSPPIENDDDAYANAQADADYESAEANALNDIDVICNEPGIQNGRGGASSD